MDTRLYHITPKPIEGPEAAPAPDGKGRLIEAKHPSQALRHVAKEMLEVRVPTAVEAARLIRAGVKVEQINGADPDNPTPEIPF